MELTWSQDYYPGVDFSPSYHAAWMLKGYLGTLRDTHTQKERGGEGERRERGRGVLLFSFNLLLLFLNLGGRVRSKCIVGGERVCI